MGTTTWTKTAAVLGILGGVAFSIVACSSAPPEGAGADSKDVTEKTEKSPTAKSDPTKTSPSATTSSSAPAASTAAPDTAGGDEACAAKDGDACTTCCGTLHPEGETAYDDAYYDCLCVAARCENECAKSECSDDDNAPDVVPGDACDVCMKKFVNDEGTGLCDKAGETAAKASAAGAAYVACDDKCE